MIGRTAARVLAVGLLGLSIAGVAYAGRGHGGGGGHGGGHFAGSGRFHGGGHAGHFAGSGGFHHFHHGGHFHRRVFIGGAVYAPFYFPPPPYYYYPPPPVQYIEPYPAPSAPQSSYWFYCPDSGAYYPYVQQCPSGWQQVMPQPPSQ